MKRILIVVGTRPNFIKVTRFKDLAKEFPFLDVRIAHTGQHNDRNMSKVFFEQFNLHPDFFLNVSNDSALQQFGDIIKSLDNLLQNTFYPDLIITPGDVNSTLAAALVSNKHSIELAHLESGLRSNDRSMPEEINRIITDELADYYFVTEKSGRIHLEDEYKKGKAFMVGNTMIDTLVHFQNEIEGSTIISEIGIEREYLLATFHRPSNVDNISSLKSIISILKNLSQKYDVVFPIHPRTKKNLERFGLEEEITQITGLQTIPALGYFEFQHLIKNAKFVITDSGGIQEETTFQQVPCLTLRENTERPITIEKGTNTLVSLDYSSIKKLVRKIETGEYKKGEIPKFWDGQSTQRILEIINNL